MLNSIKDPHQQVKSHVWMENSNETFHVIRVRLKLIIYIYYLLIFKNSPLSLRIQCRLILLSSYVVILSILKLHLCSLNGYFLIQLKKQID